jgi:hypothetical protein
MAGGLALLASGCAPTDVLNPQFLAAVGGGQQASNLPGEAPAVIVEVENQAGRVLEFRLTWRDVNEEVQQRTGRLAAGETYSEAVICPMTEVTLGDVGNLQSVGAIVRLGGGNADDPFVEVAPFGVLLQEGINYNCGDSITFRVSPSGATLSGYQVFGFVRRSGAQTAP